MSAKPTRWQLRAEVCSRGCLFGTGLVGAINVGNTCWLNALLQLLVHCRPFVSFFVSFYSHLSSLLESAPPLPSYPRDVVACAQSCVDRACLVQALANALVCMASRGPVPIDVQPVLTALDACAPEIDGGTGHSDALATGSQLDAAEMLRLLLGFVADATGIWGSRRVTTPVLLQRSTDSLPPSLVTEIFSGTLLSRRTCLLCGEARVVQESFLDLHVSVEARSNQTLAGAFTAYFGSQNLACTCRTCGHSQARQSHQLLRTPEAMLVVVKRWENSTEGIVRSSGLFDIGPLDGVSLAQFMDLPDEGERRAALAAAEAVLAGESEGITEDQRAVLASHSGIYDVVAVACHVSRGTATGHYTAYARAMGRGPASAAANAPDPIGVAELADFLGVSLPQNCVLQSPESQPWVRFNDDAVDLVPPESIAQAAQRDAYILTLVQRPTPEQERLRSEVEAAVLRDSESGEGDHFLGGLWLWRLHELGYAGTLVDIDLRCPWCDGLSPFLPTAPRPTDFPQAVRVSASLYSRLERLYGSAAVYHGRPPQPCCCSEIIEQQRTGGAVTV